MIRDIVSNGENAKTNSTTGFINDVNRTVRTATHFANDAASLGVADSPLLDLVYPPKTTPTPTNYILNQNPNSNLPGGVALKGLNEGTNTSDTIYATGDYAASKAMAKSIGKQVLSQQGPLGLPSGEENILNAQKLEGAYETTRDLLNRKAIAHAPVREMRDRAIQNLLNRIPESDGVRMNNTIKENEEYNKTKAERFKVVFTNNQEQIKKTPRDMLFNKKFPDFKPNKNKPTNTGEKHESSLIGEGDYGDIQ